LLHGERPINSRREGLNRIRSAPDALGEAQDAYSSDWSDSDCRIARGLAGPYSNDSFNGCGWVDFAQSIFPARRPSVREGKESCQSVRPTLRDRHVASARAL